MTEAPAPSRWASPLLAVIILAAWTLRVWGLVPWESTLRESAWPPLTYPSLDLGLRWVILGGIPILWARTVDAPLSWRLVLFPTTGFARPLPWGALIAGALYLTSLVLQAPEQAHTQTRHLFLGLVHHSGPTLALVGTVASFAAVAVVEETLFRGYLLGRFCQLWGFTRATLSQSALFALIHVPGWALTTHNSALDVAAFAGTAFAYGLIAGVVVLWGGSIVWGFVLHIAANLVSSGVWADARLLILPLLGPPT